MAARPADEDHPYGHGRFETLSAFVVGIILTAAGAIICYDSLQAVGAEHAPPLADYIDRFYNRTRRHSHLGGVSPEQFEAAQKPR